MSQSDTHVLARRRLDADFEVVDADWRGPSRGASAGEDFPSELADALAAVEQTDLAALDAPEASLVETELTWEGRELRVFGEEYTTGKQGFEGILVTVVAQTAAQAPAEPVVPEPTDAESLERALGRVLDRAAAHDVAVPVDHWNCVSRTETGDWQVELPREAE
jgi:hypothetical protein